MGDLGGVEAVDLGVPRAARAVRVVAAEGVGRVEQQPEAVALGELLEHARGGAVAPHVHREDAGGARGDRRLDAGGIERVGERVDVAEDRPHALAPQGVGVRDEGEGGDDDVAFHAERVHGELEGDRGVAGGDAVAGACDARHLGLERLRHRAEVGQPAAVEQRLHAREEGGTVRHVRAPDVQGLGERGRVAEQGERGAARRATRRVAGRRSRLDVEERRPGGKGGRRPVVDREEAGGASRCSRRLHANRFS